MCLIESLDKELPIQRADHKLELEFSVAQRVRPPNPHVVQGSTIERQLEK